MMPVGLLLEPHRGGMINKASQLLYVGFTTGQVIVPLLSLQCFTGQLSQSQLSAVHLRLRAMGCYVHYI